MSAAGLFHTTDGEGYKLGAHGDLLASRLAYIERHGARFLFNNALPPAPGWPRLRKGKVVS